MNVSIPESLKNAFSFAGKTAGKASVVTLRGVGAVVGVGSLALGLTPIFQPIAESGFNSQVLVFPAVFVPLGLTYLTAATWPIAQPAVNRIRLALNI